MFAVAYKHTMASAKHTVEDDFNDAPPRKPSNRDRVIEMALEWQERQAALEERHKREMERKLAEAVERHKVDVQIFAANAVIASRRGGFHPTYILKRISKATGIPVQEIKGGSRSREVSFARFAAVYWIRRKCVMSLPEIGKMLGGRDHTTILHSKTEYVRRRKAMGRTLRKVW